MLNKVLLQGRVASDVKDTVAKDGNVYAKIMLAVPRNGRKRVKGQPVHDFVPLRAYGRMGELALMYLQKGQCIVVEGEIRSNAWQTVNGGYFMAQHIDVKRVFFDRMKDPPVDMDQITPAKDGFDDGGELPREDADTLLDTEDGSAISGMAPFDTPPADALQDKGKGKGKSKSKGKEAL